MFPDDIRALATETLSLARDLGLMIATAESCTGGLVAGALTEIPGSSDVVDRGFVTYSNNAKRDMLGVPGDLLADYGAVSEPVAIAMAEGALAFSQAGLSVSITGVAGPGGGSALKPVGHVHFAAARRGCPTLHEVHRFGDLSRERIRALAVVTALSLLLKQMGAAP